MFLFKLFSFSSSHPLKRQKGRQSKPSSPPSSQQPSKNANYGSWDFDTADTDQRQLLQDSQLVSIASKLLGHILHHAQQHGVSEEKEGPGNAHRLALTAIEAAEANGAVPPLTPTQRQSFVMALEEVAKHRQLSFDSLSDTEDPSHWFDVAQEGGGAVVLKPELSSLLEILVALDIPVGNGGDATGGAESEILIRRQRGGDVGNISVPLSSSSSRTGDTNVVAPQEGRTERVERDVAEHHYMTMEVTGFEPHAVAVTEHRKGGGNAVGGDAPSAGGGAQTAGGSSSDTEMGSKRPPASDF